MSLTNELEKLRNLRASGDITEDEYSRAKAALLAPSPGSSEIVPLADEINPVAEEKETRQTAMLLHLSTLAGLVVPLAGIIAPILIWQIKKDELPGLDPHGKNAINWLISELIYIVISAVLILALIGIPMLIAVAILGIVFPIIAAVKANKGEVWRYPLSITFLK